MAWDRCWWLRSCCSRERMRPMASESRFGEGRLSYEGLDRVSHERARLSILTSLMTNPKGVTFNGLKELCSLPDVNLILPLRVRKIAKSTGSSNGGHVSRKA